MKLRILVTRLISGDSHFHRRRLSTAISSLTAAFSNRNITSNALYQRLSAAGLTGSNISDVFAKITKDGYVFTDKNLIYCIKDLRKRGLYNHCLEIIEWMEKSRSGFPNHALHLVVIYKVKGIDEVEKFFDSIPPISKNEYVYGALLNCYCTELMTDKALAVFEKMDELNYAPNVLAFNSIATLYMKVGQPEKVPILVEDMKKRNIPLNSYMYFMLIQSYGKLADLEGLERVIHEVQEQEFVKDDWQIYSNLASVYIEISQLQKAKAALDKMEKLMDVAKYVNPKEYHYLIGMYSSIGDLASIKQAWHKLKSKVKVCPNGSYISMLQALSKIDDMEGLEECFEEWELNHRQFDERIPAVVIDAYLRRDMLEEAEQLLKDVEDRADWKFKIVHVIFMKYFLKKHHFDSALKHLGLAMAARWMPVVEKLDPFFEHFKEEKDVDNAEGLCGKLEKVKLLDSRAYSWLLQIYAAAGKCAPEMRKRMEENGVEISNELDELLQKVC